MNWMILGDFNYIRYPQNRNREGGNINDMLLFNEAISRQAVVEIPHKGRNFTWSNMQENPWLEQLDWCFSSCQWTQTYPNTLVTSLGKSVLDQSPCMVNIETCIPRSKIFHVKNYWINHTGFLDTTQASLSKPCHTKNSAALLCKKLKTLRYDLKKWSKGISRLSVLIQNCNWALSELDGLEDQRPLSTPESNFRMIVKAHLLKLMKFQNEYWRKRCTIRYIKLSRKIQNSFMLLQQKDIAETPLLRWNFLTAQWFKTITPKRQWCSRHTKRD